MELPTVRRSGRWGGGRGLEAWSEGVDGEEFLEALLLVVLKARVSVRGMNTRSRESKRDQKDSEIYLCIVGVLEFLFLPLRTHAKVLWFDVV